MISIKELIASVFEARLLESIASKKDSR